MLWCMRTTLTLDDDVAAKIERLRKTRNESLRDLVNEALREGLKSLAAPKGKGVPFRTEAVDLGRCLVGNVDNVAEVLAVAEGESFR
jgi:Arc/MetJ family transcription regulator